MMMGMKEMYGDEDEEGNMDQLILVAIVTLCWVLSVEPWSMVKARVRVPQGVSHRRARKSL